MRTVDRYTIYLSIPFSVMSISFWLVMDYFNQNDPELVLYSIFDLVPTILCGLVTWVLKLDISFEQTLLMVVPTSLVFWNMVARFLAILLSKKR